MKESYKFVNGKIMALDVQKSYVLKYNPNYSSIEEKNKYDMIEYEYQDNIGEVLKQENVVEEINKTLKVLNETRDFKIKTKNSFMHMFFNDDFGGSVMLCIMVGVISAVLALGGLMGEFNMNELFITILRFISGSSLISLVPVSIYQVKKYKKANKLELTNIEEQIKEFENELNIEQKKLNELKKDKRKKNLDKVILDSNIYIDNSKIETFSNITKRKKLYQFYRDNCIKIKKLSEKGILNTLVDNTFTIDDINILDEMSKSANKVLEKNKKLYIKK